MGFSYKRSVRVRDLILKEISNMIIKREIKDPRVSSVVLTNAYVSDDMSYAKLYFTTLTKDQDIKKVAEGLESSTGFIRKKLSSRLRMKRIPKIKFEYDSVMEKGYRVDEILRDVTSDES